MTHAGALWRDEVSAINLAITPSIKGLWSSLQYDSFPIGYSLVLRLWSAPGWGGSDSVLRLLGLFVGISVLGAIWLAVWEVRRSPPLISLMLFGLNPLAIRMCDSIRPYGLGIFFVLLTFGLTWKVVEKPTFSRIFIAAVAAIFSVQCLYQNAFLILAVCVAGIAVALRNGKWERSLLVTGIGLTAGLSLSPYLGIVKKAQEWAVILRTSFGFEIILNRLSEALSSPSPLMLWVWAGFVVFGLSIATASLLRHSSRVSRSENDVMTYSVIAMIVGVLGFFFFFQWAGVPPEPWYFLPPVGLAAICLDVILRGKTKWKVWRIAVCFLIFTLMICPVLRKVQVRQTNIDFVASRLQESAQEDDTILLMDWFLGISFGRYYGGNTFWTTIPPLEDLRIHRYDLVKRKMVSSEPIRPLLFRVTETLQRGSSVWLVGTFPPVESDRRFTSLPPAPHSEHGWNIRPYLYAWKTEILYLIGSNASKVELLSGPSEVSTNPYENLPVVRVSGFKDR